MFRKSLAAAAILSTLLEMPEVARASNRLMLSCDGVNTYEFINPSQPRHTDTVQGRSLVIDLDQRTLLWGGASQTTPITEITETKLVSKATIEDNYLMEYSTNIDRISGTASTFVIYKYPQTQQWAYTLSQNLTCRIVRERMF